MTAYKPEQLSFGILGRREVVASFDGGTLGGGQGCASCQGCEATVHRDENRIKEPQLGLFADRTSCAKMQANPLRLYCSSFAYCLLQALRRLGLAGTVMAKAQCGTLREKLLMVGARVQLSVRKPWVSLPTAYPYAAVFIHAYRQLRMLPMRI